MKRVYQKVLESDIIDEHKLHRIIAEDITHNREEGLYYCMGRIGEGILTVRFTYRGNVIRIYGAGFWREGREI